MTAEKYVFYVSVPTIKTEKKGKGKTIKFTYFPSNTHSHTKRVVFYPLMTSFKQNKESFREESELNEKLLK